MTQDEYWYSKSSQDKINSDLQHEAAMSSLITEQEYKLFSMLKPKVSVDGNEFCVLHGENLQDGIAGFGKTVYLAILDFNKQFNVKLL